MQDVQKWQAVPLGHWIETITGQHIQVTEMGSRHRKNQSFAVELLGSDDQAERFLNLMKQHFNTEKA